MPQAQIDFQPAESSSIDFQPLDFQPEAPTPQASTGSPAEPPKPTAPAPRPEIVNRLSKAVTGPGSFFGTKGVDINKPLINFEASGPGSGGDIAQGVTGAFQGAASGMTTPKTAGIITALWGASMIPVVGPVIDALAAVGFGGKMLYDVYQQSPQFAAQVKAGDVRGAARTLTEMGIYTAMGAGALLHAGSKAPKAIKGLRDAVTPGKAAEAPRAAPAAAPKIDFEPEPSAQSTVARAASEATRRIDEIVPETAGPAGEPSSERPANVQPPEQAPDNKLVPVEPPVQRTSTDQQALNEQHQERTRIVPQAAEEPAPQARQPQPDKAPKPPATPAEKSSTTVEGKGTTSTVRTPNQTKAKIQYKLTEADELKTSFDEGYDQRFQPRNTERKGSRQRVEQRKGDLDPEAMGYSRMAGDGAPITSGGMAVTRNHGLQALKELYRAGSEKAQQYREWAIENAGLAGISPEDAAKMRNPVLHRELREQWGPDEIAKFAQEANASSVARMSDAELAEQMAKKLTGAAMQAFDPSADGVPNPAFVRGVIADLPAEEQAIFFDKNGELSQSGVRLVRNAVFARAYPNRGAIERMSEATDSSVRNITNGMLKAASDVARMQEGIDQGDLHQLSIAQDIGDAAQVIDELRTNKKNVDDWLRQETLEGRNQLVDDLVQIFSVEARRPNVIAETLKNYTRGVEAAGNPKQAGMFAAEVPEKVQVLNDAYEAAKRSAAEAKRGKPKGDETLFGSDAGNAPYNAAKKAGVSEAPEGGTLGFLGSQYAARVWNQNVAPALVDAGMTINQAGVHLLNFFAPRVLAEKTGLDLAMKLKGERAEQMFKLEAIFSGVKKMFAKQSEADLIKFIDRTKRGQAQPTKELDDLVATWRRIDDRLYSETLKAKPGAKYVDNHFRVFWKVLPSPVGELPTGIPTGFRGIFSRSRRPLRGTMGFLKRHTLEDISEGIARGGVPVSYNPQVLFEMSVMDTTKFLTAQRMWEGAKSNGLLKFGRGGSPRIPPGYVHLDDAIANKYSQVYFGSKIPGTPLVDVTGQTVAKTGEWFVEESFGRLLNNFLSRDELRNKDHLLGMIGSGALWLKNVQTAYELSFSPFHALFETSDAWSSELARGVTRVWNQGIVQGDPAQFLKGLGEIAGTPRAPFTASRLGGSVIRYVADPRKFLATARGAEFIKDYPAADRMISDLFLGGGDLAMNDDYRIKTLQAFQTNLANIGAGKGAPGDFVGAAVRTFPAMNEALMKPLFEKYIPRLKIGFFLKEYSQAIEQATGAGRAYNPAELSRKVWDRVENRFGEMNFSNLFWPNTLKSGLQLGFRSVTWWLGNMRAIASGFTGQGREIRDWVHTGRTQGQKLPYLDMGFVWSMIALPVTAAVMSNMFQILHGQGPTKDLTDVIHPRIGGVDDRGHPIRINIVSYLRTYEAMVKDPMASFRNATASVMTHMPEILENRDYFGNYIADPDAPAYERWWADIMHMAGTPFSAGSIERARQQGVSDRKAVELFLFTKAAGDVDFTPAERALAHAVSKRGFRMTPGELEKSRAEKVFERRIRAGDPAAEGDLDKAVDDGLLTGRQRKNVERIGSTPPDELRQSYMQAGVKRLGIEDALKVFMAASPQEKEWLREELEHKERLIDKLPAVSRERIRRQFDAAMGAALPAGVQ